MKRRLVVYLPAAQRDLYEAFQYILKDSPAQAAAWIERLDKAIGRLASFPLSGTAPRDPHLAAQGYRLIVIDEHLAFHVVRAKTIEIRRIVHGRRRYGFIL